MFACSRHLARQSSLFARTRPYLLSRSMASAKALPKQEWLVIIPDRFDASQRRQQVRNAHLEGIKPKVESGLFVLGGAILEEPMKGNPPKMNGSALVMAAETKEEVLEVLKADVYTKNEVWDWDKVQIFPFVSAIRTAL